MVREDKSNYNHIGGKAHKAYYPTAQTSSLPNLCVIYLSNVCM